jgi:hypothetical protein
VDNKKNGTAEDDNNKEILGNPTDPKKKLKTGPQLTPNRNSRSSFSFEKILMFYMEDIRYA